MADATLDVKGLMCPLPVLKAKKAMRTLQPGGTLEVWATDKGAIEDFNDFCAVEGHELVSSGEADGVFHFVLRRAS